MTDDPWDDEDPFADPPPRATLDSPRVDRGTSLDHDDPFDGAEPGWPREVDQAVAGGSRRARRRRWFVGTLVAFVSLVVLVAIGPPVDQRDRTGVDPSSDRAATPAADGATAPASPTPDTDPDTATASAALAELKVKGRAPQTGYDRDAFGQAWADVDRNGCDTRNDILRRDLDPVQIRPGTRGCVVERGTLEDPFSGEQLSFERGYDTSILVQVDHVVSLSNAWQTGAQFWDGSRREQFANDPLNLLAVDGPLNSQKSDGDAATWLPPDRTFWCEFVSRQVAVKAKYGLWVTPPERQAIRRVLTDCPGEPLVTR